MPRGERQHDDSVLIVPSEIVVMLTFPAGETGEPLLAKMPARPNAESITMGVAPVLAARCPKDQTPCTTNDPAAMVVREVVADVFVAGSAFVVNPSSWAVCLTLNQDAA
jgi:hypothetical protein